MVLPAGFEPRPHWRKAGARITAQPLPPPPPFQYQKDLSKGKIGLAQNDHLKKGPFKKRFLH